MRKSQTMKRAPTEQTNESDDDWRKWCRLCAKRDMVGSADIFNKNEEVDNATTIGKYFWVNVRQNEELPKKVCRHCSTLLSSLVAFTERVYKVQAMFCLLQNSSPSEPVDTNEVRLQYGLIDEEWHHMMDHRYDIAVGNQRLEGNRDGNKSVGHTEKKEVMELDEQIDIEDEVEDIGEEITFELANEEGTMMKRISPRRTRRQRSAKDSNITIEFEDGIEQSENDTTQEDEYITGDTNTMPIELEEQEDPEMDDVKELNIHDEEDDEEDEDDMDEHKSSDDVEDSDLFKEFKYNVDNDMYDVSEDRANYSDDSGSAEHTINKRRKKVRPVVHPVPGRENALHLLTRKRGRPPKNSMIGLKQVKLEGASETEADCENTSNDGPNERKYKCSICGRQYKNPTSYRKHMLDLHMTTPDIPDFVCEKCPDRTFPTERQLAAHKRTHLPLVDKLDIPCPYCEKKFTKIAVMRQHVNGIHYDEKPYICDVCGRALKTLAALNEHKLVHTNDCPYECEVCRKGFKNKARLKVHSDIHTDTTYVCTICGLSLNTRRTLKMHMLVHSTEKQYKCNFCPSAFKRSKALKNHLILHTGMRPYKCPFCEKSFSNGSNCRSHKRKMHPKELAEEEAAGKKSEPIAVPKLEELRVSSTSTSGPRIRAGSGIPPHLRALLIKAEMASKKAAEGGTLDKDSAFTEVDLQNYDQAIAEMIVQQTDDEDCDEEEEEEDEAGEEEEGETVIYEIIDEI